MLVKNFSKLYFYKLISIFIFGLVFISDLSTASAQGIASSSDVILGEIKATGTVEKVKFIEINKSCNFAYAGSCINVRSKPGTEGQVLFKARKGMVLRVESEVTNSKGEKWYKINFTEKLTHRVRIQDDKWQDKSFYIRADLVQALSDVEAEVYKEGDDIDDTKYIAVDISEQKLYAYKDNKVVYTFKVSTGLTDTPTVGGEYFIHYKTPSRYMQGPSKADIDKENELLKNSTSTTKTKMYTATSTNVKGYYDLPGVPFDMYFSEDGSAIHGAYWHNNFGRPHSHGCVNLNLDDAETLYRWAPVGTWVVIRE